MDLIKPDDNELYDFGNSKIKFGTYRLFSYISVYILDKEYLYKLLRSPTYIQKDILSDFLELLEYRESELYDEIDDEMTVSIDSDDESDDD